MAPKKSKTAKTALKKTRTMADTLAVSVSCRERGILFPPSADLDGRRVSQAKDECCRCSKEEFQYWWELVLGRTDELQEQKQTNVVQSTNDAKHHESKRDRPRRRSNDCMSPVHCFLQEAKALLGNEVLADTRAETKRRQAAVKAKTTLKKVSKPALKRAGTMAKTARVSDGSHLTGLDLGPFRKEKRTSNEPMRAGRKQRQRLVVVAARNKLAIFDSLRTHRWCGLAFSSVYQHIFRVAFPRFRIRPHWLILCLACHTLLLLLLLLLCKQNITLDSDKTSSFSVFRPRLTFRECVWSTIVVRSFARSFVLVPWCAFLLTQGNCIDSVSSGWFNGMSEVWSPFPSILFSIERKD